MKTMNKTRRTLTEKLASLINVKSMLTIICGLVFAFMSFKGDIDSDKFLEIFKMIIIFYFGAQSARITTVPGAKEDEPENEK